MRARLLVVLTLLAIALGYYALRVRPVRARAQRMRLAAESARIQMEGLAAGPTVRPEERARQERDEQRATLAKHSAAWSDRLDAFASCGEPAHLDELRLHMSRLADDCGLRIRSNLGCSEAERRALAGPGGSAHARYVAALLDRSAPPSPALRRITFESDFNGLRRFLSDLRGLPGRVVILGFEIHAVRAATAPALRTELVIAY